MLGFELRISGVGSDRSANLATATAQQQDPCYVWINSPLGLHQMIAQIYNHSHALKMD